MFDCIFKRILGDKAGEDGNSLFRKILPITHCESRFCGRNRRLAVGKCFDPKILGEEIKKNTFARISADFADGANGFLLAESASRGIHRRSRSDRQSYAQRFDTAQRLT